MIVVLTAGLPYQAKTFRQRGGVQALTQQQ